MLLISQATNHEAQGQHFKTKLAISDDGYATASHLQEGKQTNLRELHVWYTTSAHTLTDPNARSTGSYCRVTLSS